MVQWNKKRINKVKNWFAKKEADWKKYKEEAPQRRAAELQKLKQEVAAERQKLALERTKAELRKLKQSTRPTYDPIGGIIGKPPKKKGEYFRW